MEYLIIGRKGKCVGSQGLPVMGLAHLEIVENQVKKTKHRAGVPSAENLRRSFSEHLKALPRQPLQLSKKFTIHHLSRSERWHSMLSERAAPQLADRLDSEASSRDPCPRCTEDPWKWRSRRLCRITARRPAQSDSSGEFLAPRTFPVGLITTERRDLLNVSGRCFFTVLYFLFSCSGL